MARKLIVANWKMNPDTPREARELCAATKRTAAKVGRGGAQVVVCPPAIFLADLATNPGRLAFGAQDVAALPVATGAFTGSLSATMLRHVGAEYVIAGHSERRAMGDTDEVVNKKIKIALRQNLKVILCVGETTRDHHGHYLATLKNQLLHSLAKIDKKSFSKIIIAYEPVWAIGVNAKESDTPADFLHNAIFIKKVVASIAGATAAKNLSILYGGSVTEKNAASFLTEGGADGLLVGRASLDPVKFKQIINLAS